MLKRSEAPLTGNERYEGFCIDILKEIADVVGIRYSYDYSYIICTTFVVWYDNELVFKLDACINYDNYFLFTCYVTFKKMLCNYN